MSKTEIGGRDSLASHVEVRCCDGAIKDTWWVLRNTFVCSYVRRNRSVCPETDNVTLVTDTCIGPSRAISHPHGVQTGE